EAGGEGDRGPGDARVADDRDHVARDQGVRVAHLDVREHDVGAHGLLVVPLLDLEDRQVVSRVAGYVPRPEVELRWLVGEGGVGDEDRVPLVVLAHTQVTYDVVVGEDVAGRADYRARSGPVDRLAGGGVEGDYLNDRLNEVEPDISG